MDKRLSLICLMVLLLPTVKAQVYFKNETANFILTLSDAFGKPISNANCSGYIFDSGFNLYDSFNLSYNPNAGVYYHQFNVPSTSGTYLEVGKCEINLFGSHKILYDWKTFFVSSSLKEFQNEIHSLVSNATLNITLDITGNITQSMQKFYGNMTMDDLVSLLFALHSTPITKQYCEDENTLVQIRTANWTIGHKVYPIEKIERINCPYGCDTKLNECRPDPRIRLLYAIGIIVFLAVVLLLIRRWLR